MQEKLHKVLANAGIGSRREMERWIQAGRVSVNGKLATLGDRVDEDAKVRIDGNPVTIKADKTISRVLIYNKPEGEICTNNDPEGRTTVFERLPNLHHGRWIAVGRLDVNTSGLLLFTNDGELANRLMHPKFEVTRIYAVRVFGEVNNKMLQRLRTGVELEDGKAKFDSIKVRSNAEDTLNNWFDVTLSEGKNREVRRLWESQDVTVSRLIRLAYGQIELPKRLPQGAWVEAELKEVNILRKAVQLPAETETILGINEGELDHKKLSRMRRSVKKHKERTKQQAPSVTKRSTKNTAPSTQTAKSKGQYSKPKSR